MSGAQDFRVLRVIPRVVGLKMSRPLPLLGRAFSVDSRCSAEKRPLIRLCSLVLNNDEYGPNGPISFLNPKSNYSHYALMMPYLTAGQAGGALKSGRNLVYAVDKEGKGPPHAQLLVSVLNAMGIPDQTFGDPMAKQGPLPRMLG